MTLALALTVPLLCTGYTVPAEPEGVSGIREFYAEVHDLLDDEYGLYMTTVEINPEGLPYPAVGTYGEVTSFFWELDQEYGETDLLFVTHSSSHAAHTEYQELLFDREGELIFRFGSFDNGDGMRYEYRRWFAGGDLLHATDLIVDPEGTEYFEPGELLLMRDPDYFTELFAASR